MEPSERNAYHLASMAGCASPDSLESAGAVFLGHVADGVEERADEWDEDAVHEIADGAVPIYTYHVWSTFVDLAAYNEDPTELGADASDLEQAAKVALYMIAERLVYALREADATDEDDD